MCAYAQSYGTFDVCAACVCVWEAAENLYASYLLLISLLRLHFARQRKPIFEKKERKKERQMFVIFFSFLTIWRTEAFTVNTHLHTHIHFHLCKDKIRTENQEKKNARLITKYISFVFILSPFLLLWRSKRSWIEEK